MLGINFVLFLKIQVLREFQNTEKFEIFWQKHEFEKGMHGYVSNDGVNRNSSKQARFKVFVQPKAFFLVLVSL